MSLNFYYQKISMEIGHGSFLSSQYPLIARELSALLQDPPFGQIYISPTWGIRIGYDDLTDMHCKGFQIMQN
jgi:hypothetical protein